MLKTVLSGTAHKLPIDLKKVLTGDTKALAHWNDLTPLARYEWICWVIFPKKAETRADHITRMRAELKQGKRRPCCWLGCTHRKDKSVSPSVQAILRKQKR